MVLVILSSGSLRKLNISKMGYKINKKKQFSYLLNKLSNLNKILSSTHTNTYHNKKMTKISNNKNTLINK